jgi:hypothetical protein
MSRVLEFSEWRLGDRNLNANADGKVEMIPVTDLVVFRLDTGWMVLDVHEWLDRLLGSKLDDCWTQGFAICRQDNEMRTVTLSYNRKQRPLRGEFDLYTSRILPMDRPIACGIDGLTRPWIVPRGGTLARIWQYER